MATPSPSRVRQRGKLSRAATSSCSITVLASIQSTMAPHVTTMRQMPDLPRTFSRPVEERHIPTRSTTLRLGAPSRGRKFHAASAPPVLRHTDKRPSASETRSRSSGTLISITHAIKIIGDRCDRPCTGWFKRPNFENESFEPQFCLLLSSVHSFLLLSLSLQIFFIKLARVTCKAFIGNPGPHTRFC